MCLSSTQELSEYREEAKERAQMRKHVYSQPRVYGPENKELPTPEVYEKSQMRLQSIRTDASVKRAKLILQEKSLHVERQEWVKQQKLKFIIGQPVHFARVPGRCWILKV